MSLFSSNICKTVLWIIFAFMMPLVAMGQATSSNSITAKQNAPAAAAAAAVPAVQTGADISSGGGPSSLPFVNVLPLPAKDGSIDYNAWESTAKSVEEIVSGQAQTVYRLEDVREILFEWRKVFEGAQSTNKDRIETVKSQLRVFTPSIDGKEVPSEVTPRQEQLEKQLKELEAPSVRADEAYKRANGLIREVDVAVRESHTEKLLKRFPSPLNPSNWAFGVDAVSKTLHQLVHEVSSRQALMSIRANITNNLPLMITLLVVGLGLIIGGFRLTTRVSKYIASIENARKRKLYTILVLFIGRVVMPVVGALILMQALHISGLFGIVGKRVIDSLLYVSLVFFLTLWLAQEIFPKSHDVLALKLSDGWRQKGRVITISYGALISLQIINISLIGRQDTNEAAYSVINFPFLCLMAFILFVLSLLLQSTYKQPNSSSGDVDDISDTKQLSDAEELSESISRAVGRGVMVVSVVGVVAGAAGYMEVALAVLSPIGATFILFATIRFVQEIITDLYALIMRSDEAVDDDLAPVLINLALVVASLPLFAMLWGVSTDELLSIWHTLLNGVSIGETRISLTNLIIFIGVFVLGYMATRLFQASMKTSILPRTRMDIGARNALISGVGYLGIFLAALIAVHTAGLNLSGLAIVAGALSVGIGFGLQNIVSNFVSGIILLIERPVSLGDWIQVGEVEGFVTAISVRSTRIRTFDYRDIIIPNSDLIAGQVANWNGFSRVGRISVQVGVAYGSDTDKVSNTLYEIAIAQDAALHSPQPSVLLSGFGDNTIDFDLRVFVRDISMGVYTASSIRHQIVKKFAEENIVIAFPQRDIHIQDVDHIIEKIRFGSAAKDVKAAPEKPSEEKPAGASSASG